MTDVFWSAIFRHPSDMTFCFRSGFRFLGSRCCLFTFSHLNIVVVRINA